MTTPTNKNAANGDLIIYPLQYTASCGHAVRAVQIQHLELCGPFAAVLTETQPRRLKYIIDSHTHTHTHTHTHARTHTHTHTHKHSHCCSAHGKSLHEVDKLPRTQAALPSTWSNFTHASTITIVCASTYTDIHQAMPCSPKEKFAASAAS